MSAELLCEVVVVLQRGVNNGSGRCVCEILLIHCVDLRRFLRAKFVLKIAQRRAIGDDVPLDIVIAADYPYVLLAAFCVTAQLQQPLLGPLVFLDLARKSDVAGYEDAMSTAQGATERNDIAIQFTANVLIQYVRANRAGLHKVNVRQLNQDDFCCRFGHKTHQQLKQSMPSCLHFLWRGGNQVAFQAHAL